MSAQLTDRELLEFAAKAAGIELIDWNDCWVDIGPGYRYQLKDGSREVWNPIHDDGDAFRLAVKLRIGTDFSPSKVYIHQNPYIVESLFLEPEAVVRRAIVVASAEIGKAMP